MTEYTQVQIDKDGYGIQAAPNDDWRDYDENNPIPGYFQFDWLSARHPDLYHKFALSSVGLVVKLNTLVDLSDLDVLDVGAGTGRITQGVAQKARRVTAVDIFESVVEYGNRLVHQAGLENVAYVRGDNARLPLVDNSFDVAVCAWAAIHYAETYRVLKPNGYLIDLIPAPGTLCGELTPILADTYPDLITEVAPASQFDPSCPEEGFVLQEDMWNGVPVIPPILVHDFTYVADYADYLESSAILGRLYGPIVRKYMLDGKKSTMSWRLRVVINRIRK